MSDERPKDLTVALRQISNAMPLHLGERGNYPGWFKCGEPRVWKDLLKEAADELEQMQKLNGRLLKRLAGD